MPKIPQIPERFALGLLMFLLGACGLAYEYTLSKIASDLLGNSVQQWATMIATMLFAMGLGAEAQKKTPTTLLADRLVSTQVMLAVLGGFGPMILIYSFALVSQLYIVIQYGLAFGVGILIGYEIPLMMRINEQDSPEMRINLAQVLKMDYIGALAGALLWTFFLIRFLSIEKISFLIGIISLFSAMFCAMIYRKRLTRTNYRLIEMSIGFTLLLLGFIFGRQLMVRAEQYLYRDPIVTSITSPFQHIVLTKNRSGKVRCYINGHLQFSEEDEAIYHENLVHPAMHLAENRQRILILGGGDGLALREVLQYPEVKQVTLVDLDPTITQLAIENPELVRMNRGSMKNAIVQRIPSTGIIPGEAYQHYQVSQHERFPTRDYPTANLHLLHVDAAEFVKAINGQYDVVIMDFPDPNSPDLSKLYGRPFYDHIAKVLAPAGVVVQQSGSCYQAREAFLCIGRTWKAAGFHAVPYHDHIPSFGEWGWWIAKKGQTQENTSAALRQISHLGIETTYLTPQLIASSLVFGKNHLFSTHEDFTSLTEPRVYHYFLQGWNPDDTP